MKNLLIKPIFALVFAAMVSSCAVTLPVDVSDNARGNKTAVSESIVLFETLYFNGKYGLHDAIKSSNFKGKIFCVDEKTTNYILFKKKELIITSGE